jgi:hypothetical protein
MGGMVGFQDQGATAHLPNPGFGQSRSLQKPSGSFNVGETGSYPVRDSKLRLKSLLQFSLLLIITVDKGHPTTGHFWL